MNLKSLVVVVIRLLALNFLLQACISLAPQFIRFTQLFQRGRLDDADVLLSWSWMLMVGLVGGAVLLWMFALPIARLVTRDLPQELSLGVPSVADCYFMGFIGVGLFYMTGYF